MSIEFRGDNKYRFRVRKGGVPYSLNYFCDKKLSQEVGVYLNAYNNHLLEEFGNDSIGKIKKLKIVQFKNKKLKTHSPASVKLYLSIMAHTLSKGVEWELIAKNPCENVGVDVERKKNYTELLSAEGIAKLIVFINNEPEVFKTIFTTAIGMGYRIGETIGLTVPVVDFEENSIDISTQLLRYNEDNHTKYETSKPKSPNSVRKSCMPNFVSSTLEAWIRNIKVTDLEQHLFVNPLPEEYKASAWRNVG